MDEETKVAALLSEMQAVTLKLCDIAIAESPSAGLGILSLLLAARGLCAATKDPEQSWASGMRLLAAMLRDSKNGKKYGVEA